jgi:hypothetical protein
MIGKDWLTAATEDGHRRLDDPNDFVRLETAIALKRNIPVIPVLVHGAQMPKEQDLPDDLKPLAYRNGVEITHARWDSDVQDLIEALKPYLDEPVKATAAEPQKPKPKRSPLVWIASVAALILVIAGGVLIFVRKPTPVPPGPAPVVDANPAVPVTAAFSRVLTSAAGDTVQILKVTPAIDVPLKSGVDTSLVFLMHYTLTSRDKAELVVSLNQSAADAGGCAAHELRDEGRIPIQRGDHQVDLTVLWHGGTSKGTPQSQGFLNPFVSIWGPGGQKRLASFGVREACWHFVP